MSSNVFLNRQELRERARPEAAVGEKGRPQAARGLQLAEGRAQPSPTVARSLSLLPPLLPSRSAAATYWHLPLPVQREGAARLQLAEGRAQLSPTFLLSLLPSLSLSFCSRPALLLLITPHLPLPVQREGAARHLPLLPALPALSLSPSAPASPPVPHSLSSLATLLLPRSARAARRCMSV